MVDILATTDFPLVRAALDVTLDAVALPDAIISQSIYQFAGEAQVKARVLDWQTRTGDDAIHIKNAAVYYVAALLCPTIPVLKSERSTEGQQYDRQTVDWSDLAAEMQSRGDGELAYVLSGGESTADRPVMFVAAVGRRGR